MSFVIDFHRDAALPVAADENDDTAETGVSSSTEAAPPPAPKPAAGDGERYSNPPGCIDASFSSLRYGNGALSTAVLREISA